MNNIDFREDLKFVGTIAASMAGVFVILSYMVRRIQFKLYGLPLDMDISQLSYANVAAGLLLMMVCAAALFSPLLCFTWLITRRFRRRCKERTRGLSGMTIGFMSVVAFFVLLLPALEVVGLQDLLWRTIEPANNTAGMLPLVIGKNSVSAIARLVTSGLALGAVAFVLATAATTFADWRRKPDFRRLGMVGASGLIVCLALFAYVVLLAAIVPGFGEFDSQVTISLQSSAVPGGSTVDGLLISQTNNAVSVLSMKEGSASVVLVPTTSIARIDFRGRSKSFKHLLYRRLQYAMKNQEDRTMSIFKIPFAMWAIVGALLVVVGFSQLLPSQAVADPSNAVTDPSVIDRNARAESVLRPKLLAAVLAYYPAVLNMVGDVAEKVEMFVGMIIRGDNESSGDLWCYGVDGNHRRLTNDGGYTSLRPSKDGSHVAFLRQGHLGILDIGTGTVRLLPGDTVYERLLGWDESLGMLLAARKDNFLVRLHIADGRSEAMMASPLRGKERADLEVLARMTPSPGILMVSGYNDEWFVLEKRWGATENALLFTTKHPLSDPTWCEAGIFYVATKD